MFQTRGPYNILEQSSFGAYNCRKYGKPEGEIKKFLTEDLYMLPLAVYPSESCDTPDLRYLNADFAPLHHPFAKDFNIEAYNTRWFDSDPPQTPRKLAFRPSDGTSNNSPAPAEVVLLMPPKVVIVPLALASPKTVQVSPLLPPTPTAAPSAASSSTVDRQQ